MNQLHEELLMKVLHRVENDKSYLNPKGLIAFVQKVFNINQNMDHDAIYQSMIKKKVQF